MPKVTIGVPFYNVESEFRDAIRSVFAQSFQDWELILADDGSSDSSLEIAKSVNDPRVRVISDGKNIGRSSRRNHIISIAQGEYLAWLDADDMFHPDRLAAQVEVLDANPKLDVVDSSMYGIHNYEPMTITYRHELVPTVQSAFKRSLLAQPAAMGRLEWFRKNPSGEEMKTSEDFSLWARTVGHSRFARIYRPLYFYTEAPFNPPQTLAKYRQSQSDVRRFTKKYGPKLIGWPMVIQRVAISYAKVFLYICCTATGLQRKLMDTRGITLSETEKQEAKKTIAAIQNTVVPGLISSNTEHTHSR